MATLTRTLAPRLHPAAAARMLGNETAKGLRLMWAHRVTLAPQLLVMGVMYLLFQLVIGGGRLVPALLPVTLSAFLAYVVGYVALLKMAAGLLEEVNAGTLEQAHLSPLRPWVLALGRLGAALVEALLTALIVGAVLALALGIHLPFRPAALVPLVTTLADVAGFALLIAGLALVVTSIGAIIHVIQNMIMLLNGALIPVAAYPPGLQLAAKLVPTTLGMDTTRRILFGHEALAGVWADHSLQWALLHAAVMLLAGWGVYQAAIRRGLRDGRLGPS